MRVVGLVSGGKDSIYNLMQCVAHGHTVVAIANLAPKDTATGKATTQRNTTTITLHSTHAC